VKVDAKHPRRRLVTAVAAALLLTGVAGCGSHGSAPTASPAAGRTVEVTMTDNAFAPNQLQVSKGETVTVKFRNAGAAKHEAVIGDEATQLRHHSESTASTAAMEHGHGGEGAANSEAVSVAPGQSGALTHTFDETGAVLIGCHEPGHWEAGMKATVIVA
jgi:uncharacterized cupredoxin-like copper-binding protein